MGKRKVRKILMDSKSASMRVLMMEESKLPKKDTMKEIKKGLWMDERMVQKILTDSRLDSMKA